MTSVFFRDALRVLIANCSQFARNSGTAYLYGVTISCEFYFACYDSKILNEIELISKHESQPVLVNVLVKYSNNSVPFVRIKISDTFSQIHSKQH